MTTISDIFPPTIVKTIPDGVGLELHVGNDGRIWRLLSALGIYTHVADVL